MNGVADINSRSLDKWLDYIQEQHDKEIDMGLDRMFEMVERLDLNPITPNVVTVAGTNGKGTVCHLLEATYRHAGYKTGLFTSPHLISFSERFRIQGKPVSDNKLVAFFAQVSTLLNLYKLSYFELSTVIAFTYLKMNISI